MVVDAIIAYIHTERERGCGDEAIRAELARSGWTRDDIVASFAAIDPASSGGMMRAWNVVERQSTSITIIGLGALIAGTTMLFTGNVRGDIPTMASAAFLLASLLFIPGVLYALYAFFNSTKNVYYRIWIGILAITMIAFIPYTTIYFADQLLEGFLLKDLFGGIEDFAIINFLIILPLQVVAYFCAVLTLVIDRFVSKRRGQSYAPSHVLQEFSLMLAAACIGVADLYLVMNSSHWGF